jgi:hypothetical protein
VIEKRFFFSFFFWELHTQNAAVAMQRALAGLVFKTFRSYGNLRIGSGGGIAAFIMNMRQNKRKNQRH